MRVSSVLFVLTGFAVARPVADPSPAADAGHRNIVQEQRSYFNRLRAEQQAAQQARHDQIASVARDVFAEQSKKEAIRKQQAAEAEAQAAKAKQQDEDEALLQLGLDLGQNQGGIGGSGDGSDEPLLNKHAEIDAKNVLDVRRDALDDLKRYAEVHQDIKDEQGKPMLRNLTIKADALRCQKKCYDSCPKHYVPKLGHTKGHQHCVAICRQLPEQC